MTHIDLRNKFIEFWREAPRNHREIPGASLIPQNDPTVLFTTAGMHPLVPYLLGQPHPEGQRLVDVQKCLRTDDIDEVGDTIHHTFFEMLGNWSLGDYFKKDAIEWSYEFLIKVLKLDPSRLYITCFAGDQDAPKDEESAEIWMSLGIPAERIYFYPKKDNWWGPAGATGPCGPDTEMHYDVTQKPHGPDCKPGCSCGRFSEIWNDVFMQYNKTADGKFEKLPRPNVDTGMGVERTLAVVNGLDDDYLTELWKPAIDKIAKLSGKKYIDNIQSFRILADHVRAAIFVSAEGIIPSNKERGYVLRRLIRRIVLRARSLEIEDTCKAVEEIANEFFVIMNNVYPELKAKHKQISEVIFQEIQKFEVTLKSGAKQVSKETELTEIERKNIGVARFIELSLEDLEWYQKALAFNVKNRFLNNLGLLILKEGLDTYLIDDQARLLRELRGIAQDSGVKAYYVNGEIPEIRPPTGRTHQRLHEILNYFKDHKITLNSKWAFRFISQGGIPIELLKELAEEKGLDIDTSGLGSLMSAHQELSRSASAGMFKGGLADHSEIVTKYHTATHLLQAALRQVLGNSVRQEGSNLTAERLRFDFSHPAKLTPEEIENVENLVNEQIKKDLPRKMETMTYDQAIASGAMAFFKERYPGKVTVYSFGDFSREICGGPHVDNTGTLGKFKITREESVASGIRRIYATLS